MSTHTSCLGSRSQANHLAAARPVVWSTTNSRPLSVGLGLPRSSVIALSRAGHRVKRCSGLLGVRQPGNSSSSSSKLGAADKIACRATSVLAGPAAGADRATAEAVGEVLLKQWLGAAEQDRVPILKVTGPLRETTCELTVVGTAVEVKGRKHALLAFVITPGSKASKPGSGSFGITDLPNPVLHWGCVLRQGDRWQPPPAGWSTWPNVSHDARGGAWQTPFEKQQLPGGDVALTLLLQLPCDGALK
eukprot:GHRQ01012239.1.p1 GENE.GHRQ01012239.1~~GHRQ01012239.1.p1  ORF type:complete len:247 (+),score=66.02 GHRQ01012239.1:290-1030(+)